MLQTFHCPNCQASLNYETSSGDVVVTCPYCSSSVIVPDTLRSHAQTSGSSASQSQVLQEIMMLAQRGNKIEAIKKMREAFGLGLKEAKEAVEALERHEAVLLGMGDYADSYGQAGGQTSSGAGRLVGCIMFVVILGIVVTIGGSLLGGGLGIFGALTAAEVISTSESDGIATILQTVESSLPAGIDIETQSPASTATPGLASIVAEFGGQEGIGPGFFNDTRSIGIDAEGRIYTGDYSDGRIQVFDSEGNFLSQWDVSQDDYYMVTMAVNRQGIVYLLQTGNIVRFDGPTGAPMEPVAFDQSVRFEKLAVAPDNTLWAVGRDRLVHFNNDGGVLLDVVDPFERVPDFGPFLSYLAVDGAGNVYVLSNESVYKFDSSGAFADRFGGRGDEPGQFMGSASSLAVDGQGNVYVNDFAGIQVFDSNGSYKGIIDVNVTAFDMVFTEQNQLLLMDRNGNRVVTMQPNP